MNALSEYALTAVRMKGKGDGAGQREFNYREAMVKYIYFVPFMAQKCW